MEQSSGSLANAEGGATPNPHGQVPLERLCANVSILFTEVPFLQRFELAARHGFRAVECWFPYEWRAQDVRAALRDSGLRMRGINTAPGDTARGDWGLAVDPSRREAFREGVACAFDYAAAIDCPAVHVMAGLVRHGAVNGTVDSAAGRAVPALRPMHSDLHALYVSNIGWACEFAAGQGGTVLIEPLNAFDRPHYFLQTLAQAMAVIREVQRPELKLMFDVYHTQMSSGRLVESLLECLEHVGHIQIADVPGRHEPGTGEIRFDYLFSRIRESGYLERGGWIGCEYRPVADTVAGLGWRNAGQ